MRVCLTLMIMPAIILLQLDVLLANSARPQSVLLNLLREHLNNDKVDLSKLTEPPPGQRCSGRNYQGRRCCTPESPCDEGEGDCDGPGDGGGHDGHKGCKGELECGSNNCKKFGAYYHEKDDCCEKPTKPACPIGGAKICECLNRSNYCSDCEVDCLSDCNDLTRVESKCFSKLACKPLLFEDDCESVRELSQRPAQTAGDLSSLTEPPTGWGEWEGWSQCSKSCGGGTWTRSRFCRGADCRHSTQSQDRFCNTQPCSQGYGS